LDASIIRRAEAGETARLIPSRPIVEGERSDGKHILCHTGPRYGVEAVRPAVARDEAALHVIGDVFSVRVERSVRPGRGARVDAIIAGGDDRQVVWIRVASAIELHGRDVVAAEHVILTRADRRIPQPVPLIATPFEVAVVPPADDAV